MQIILRKQCAMLQITKGKEFNGGEFEVLLGDFQFPKIKSAFD